MGKGPVNYIDIEETKVTNKTTMYRVWYKNKVLLESSRDPEYEACRELLRRGITGKLVTFSLGNDVPRMKMDIEKAAKRTCVEPNRGRIRTQPYKPYVKHH